MKDFHLHECLVSKNPDQSFEGNGGEICAGIHYPFQSWQPCDDVLRMIS